MIYNRTQSDVDQAEYIIKNLKNANELTAEQIEILERGTLTINTINRIEDKQAELKSRLNEIGYWNTDIVNKTWTYYDFFHQADFDRLQSNTTTLRNAFFTFKNTPEISNNNYIKYQTINDIEKILFDIEQMIEIVKNAFRECGTFECGEE